MSFLVEKTVRLVGHDHARGSLKISAIQDDNVHAFKWFQLEPPAPTAHRASLIKLGV